MNRILSCVNWSFGNFLNFIRNNPFCDTEGPSLRSNILLFAENASILGCWIRLLGPFIAFETGHLCFLILSADLCVRLAEVVDTADVYLAGWVFGQVIHDIVSDIFYCSVATQWQSTYWVWSNMVKKCHCNCISNIFKYLLRKWRAVGVRIYFGIRISHWCFFFDIAQPLYKLGCKNINSFAIVIVALESVTVCKSSGFL